MTGADYDRLAPAYARALAAELDAKPRDRAVLQAFAGRWRGRGLVGDLGSGPGQVGAFLRRHGAEVVALDNAPAMLAECRRLHPGLPTEEADILTLGAGGPRFAALCAFYSLIHFDGPTLPLALRSIRAALRPGGELLAAIHLGEGWLHPAEMLGIPVSLGFRLFAPGELEDALREAGFTLAWSESRDPYPDAEHPTRRLMASALS